MKRRSAFSLPGGEKTGGKVAGGGKDRGVRVMRGIKGRKAKKKKKKKPEGREGGSALENPN